MPDERIPAFVALATDLDNWTYEQVIAYAHRWDMATHEDVCVVIRTAVDRNVNANDLMRAWLHPWSDDV